MTINTGFVDQNGVPVANPVATVNPPTKGLASVTHPGGITALAVLAAIGAILPAHQPQTWYEWVLAGGAAAGAVYGVLAAKASVQK